MPAATAAGSVIALSSSSIAAGCVRWDGHRGSTSAKRLSAPPASCWRIRACSIRGAEMATLAIWGSWHLGSVTAACFAELGHRVLATDLDSAILSGLRAGRPPIAEPGLSELVERHLASGRLSFHDPADPALAPAEVVFLAADTDSDHH